MEKTESKIFSWKVVQEPAAVAVSLVSGTNVGFDLVGTPRFGDTGGGREGVELDDDIDALRVIGDLLLLLLLLLHVVNWGLCFEVGDGGGDSSEDPVSDPCSLSVPAFDG
ncbi:hypothetical protein OIU84_024587 [Salix udensis]|uniref:Uncharacterized protein n=1 Tax=Salix udensis TaxID=889485 RepID=A0AAD6PBQ3_9ROSI|nr:hypothetical protein OIU84_024587 [Salix udensis]